MTDEQGFVAIGFTIAVISYIVGYARGFARGRSPYSDRDYR